MKKGFYYIVALLTVLLLWSCSTKKNTKASRFYHAFTTRYNIYFNGKQAFDEALKSQQDGYKENYSDRIYMYPISAQPKDKAEPGGPFDRTIEKSNKAIKLHSIKAYPKVLCDSGLCCKDSIAQPKPVHLPRKKAFSSPFFSSFCPFFAKPIQKTRRFFIVFV